MNKRTTKRHKEDNLLYFHNAYLSYSYNYVKWYYYIYSYSDNSHNREVRIPGVFQSPDILYVQVSALLHPLRGFHIYLYIYA